MRVAINSVLGIGGLIDIATPAEAAASTKEDFGQTLGVWGVPSARTWCCRCSARAPCVTLAACWWTA